MARPCKSTKALSDYSQTKGEIAERQKLEQALSKKGIPTAPEWLTEKQAEIYNNIVECLKDSEMLALNDVWILAQGAITIDRLQKIEKDANTDDELIYTKSFIMAKNSYVQAFFRFCNEMCLSPQSRAKLANVATTKESKKPLENLISELNGG